MPHLLKVYWKEGLVPEGVDNPTKFRWPDSEPGWTHLDDMVLMRHPDEPSVAIPRSNMLYSVFTSTP